MEGLIVVLLGSAALLLGFEVVFDTDIWWHVRSGEWILAARRVPWLDPFTFASADRPWIDLHWGFQVAVALAHRLAGVPGILILAAMVRIWNLLIVAFARNGTVIPHGEFLIEPDFHRLAVFIGVALLKRIVTGENMDGCFQALFCARPCHGLAGHLS